MPRLRALRNELAEGRLEVLPPFWIACCLRRREATSLRPADRTHVIAAFPKFVHVLIVWVVDGVVAVDVVMHANWRAEVAPDAALAVRGRTSR